MSIDQNVLVAFNAFFVGRAGWLDFVVKTLAIYLVYLLPVILLFIWFRYKNRRFEIFASLVGMLVAWFVITKWLVPHYIWFRPRPDLAAFGVKELLFHRPDYSFPSDHATALFALTFGFYMFKWKRAANWFLLYAVVIAFFRVVIGVHFPLDIIGGMFSALCGAGIAKLAEPLIKKYLFNPIMKVYKFLRIP